MKPKYSYILLLSVLIITIYSCKREEEVTRWDTNLLAPLIHSSLSINDLVVDSLLSKGTDGSLSIVYKNSLYKTSIDSLFVIPDTFATSNAKLATLKLDDIIFTYSINLGSIIRQVPFGPMFFPHGSSRQIPAMGPVSSPDVDVNGGSYFETMTLKEGSIVVKVKNELPVDLTNLTFTVKNKSDQSIIATSTFPLIKVGDTASKIISIAGKTINKEMLGKFTLSTPGSGNNYVTIDTNNAIISTLSIINLKPSSATAIFPAQNLIDTVKPITLALNPVELALVKLRKGDVLMKVSSTLQDILYLHYEIPSATKAGVPFTRDFVIPPAPPGGSSSLDLVFDFTGYDLDLKGQLGNTFNTLYTKIVARIEYTGQIKTLSLTDSIYFDVRFKKLLPNYALGYLGQQTVKVNGSTPIELFSKISGGSLALDNVSLNLNIENTVGLEGSLLINSISAKNTRSNAPAVVLSGPVIGNPQSIAAAVEASPIVPVLKSIPVDTNNSNIKNLIELMPDKLDYSLEIDINPNENTSQHKDFVHYGSGIEASLDMTIPLNLVANKLELRDTIDFSFDVDTNTTKKIIGGQLTLLADNGFPFEAAIQIYLVDNNYNKTDSLISYGKITAAPLDVTNKVSLKKRSKLIIPLDQNKITKLRKSKKLLITANFSSVPSINSVKIYSDYSIDFKLVGDFKYGVK